jgi:hypothetical protein
MLIMLGSWLCWLRWHSVPSVLAVYLAMIFCLMAGRLAVYTGCPGWLVGYTDYAGSLAVYAGWLALLSGCLDGSVCWPAMFAGCLCLLPGYTG